LVFSVFRGEGFGVGGGGGKPPPPPPQIRVSTTEIPKEPYFLVTSKTNGPFAHWAYASIRASIYILVHCLPTASTPTPPGWDSVSSSSTKLAGLTLYFSGILT
jgi:hypothetical protein